MTTEEMRRLRTLRRDARRDDEEEAEYRILLKLADLEAESAELRLIELRALASGGRLPRMSKAADEERMGQGFTDDWPDAESVEDDDAEGFGSWDGRD